MRTARRKTKPSAVFLLALSLLWLLHGIGHTIVDPLPSGKTIPVQVSELNDGVSIATVLIERDPKAAPSPLTLEFALRDRSSSHSGFALHPIAKHLLHDQFLFPSYLIYTETTSSRL